MNPKAQKTICLVGGEDAHKRIPFSGYLLKAQFEVTILGTLDHPYPEEIRYIRYCLNRKFNPVADFKTLLEYRRIFKKSHFDIIQTYDTKPAFLVPLAAWGLNVRVVRTITGMGTIFMSEAIKFRILRIVHRLLHRLVKNGVQHTTFQNIEDQKYFIEHKLVSARTSSIIYGSGIELSQDQPLAERNQSPFTFLCVARLVYEKGIINFLEAAAICRKKGLLFRFLLVGPLEEQSERLNLEILKQYDNIVEWLGPQTDVQKFMLASDAFVLPTFREGLSRVILEACSFGLPIITTDVPGTREIVRDGTEGFLTKVNDSEGLADAMIKLAANKAQADRMAKNATLRAEQFSLRIISDQYIKLYNNIT